MTQQKIPAVVHFEKTTGCQALIEGSDAIPCMYDPDKGEIPTIRSPKESDGGRRLRLVAGPRLVVTELDEIATAKAAALAEVEAAKVAASQQIANERASAVAAVKAEVI